MKIEYDKPIEVTQTQYNLLRSRFAGVVAYRKANGKYYVKVWMMSYAKMIENIIL